MSQLDPVLIASRWACGDLLPENIPQVAVGLIETGHEHPAVYRLRLKRESTAGISKEGCEEVTKEARKKGTRRRRKSAAMRQ